MNHPEDTKEIPTEAHDGFSVENFLEAFIFHSRWILAIFYLLLVFALVGLCIKFIQHFYHFSVNIFDLSETDTLLAILGLVDMTLLANLLILVIFSGYENFVSIIGVAQESQDRPKWMGGIDFAGLKLKLIGSIVALSAIYLLSAFLNLKTMDHAYMNQELGWMVGLHLTFVITGVLFALSEKISEKPSGHTH
jgi:uncharacterized protein (TIGR00645 family)